MSFDYNLYDMSLVLRKDMEELEKLNKEDLELLYLAISKLQVRFNKIDFDEYYLSYSGGKDSHLLYWFIKEFLKDDRIKIVGVNTYREHNEIRKRIYDNCDIVLYPTMKMNDINEKYGMPCFTKVQDGRIHEYQRGVRNKCTIERVHRIPRANGYISSFALNKQASELTISGKLHKVSDKCCTYTKKEPFEIYEKESGRKSILGVRQTESLQRKSKYSNCLNKTGKFTPMFDFTNEMCELINRFYNVQIPSIYNYLTRTGCVGCPYSHTFGKYELVPNLQQATKSQIKYAIDSFGKSYKIKGVYDDILMIYNKKVI